MNEDIFNYYLSKDEPNQSCLLTLKEIILQQNKDIKESIKWGLPCFSYKKKMFCFLNIDKKTNQPYILFVEGGYLKYPELEQGARKRMKILRINPNEDLQITLIKKIVNHALNFYHK